MKLDPDILQCSHRALGTASELLETADAEDFTCDILQAARVKGYSDKWAIEAPADIFSDLTDHVKILEDFMSYSNITEQPFWLFAFGVGVGCLGAGV